MSWILQAKAFNDGNPERFEEILNAKKIPFSWVRVDPFNGGWSYVAKSGPKLCPKYEVYMPSLEFVKGPKFFYGTINGFKQVATNPNWCDFKKLEFDNYAYHYNDHLVVPFLDMIQTTTGYFAKNYKWFYQYIGGNELFIRPDDNEKSFDGEVVDIDKVDLWYADTYKYNGNLNIPCWVARKEKIDQEWRVIIANGKAITASQYRLNGSIEIEQDLPKEVADFAEEMAKIYSPEVIFCIDIARLGQEFRLVEIGSIHTCGLYDCDLEKIVDAVERNLDGTT